jgi:hypothetical protein
MIENTLRFRGKKTDINPQSKHTSRDHSLSVDHTQISSKSSHVDTSALSPSEAWFLKRAREISRTLVLTDIGRDFDDMAAITLGSAY